MIGAMTTSMGGAGFLPAPARRAGAAETRMSSLPDEEDSTGRPGSATEGSGSNLRAGNAGKGPDASKPTPEEDKQIKELKRRDEEVRTHENAHKAVGGQYAGSPSYTYQTGPDGKRYAIGGEVAIDVSPEKDPESTIRKMEIVKRAAMAPAEPSPQDAKVAAQADQIRLRAQQELSKQRGEGFGAPSGQGDGSAQAGDQAGRGQGGEAGASLALSLAAQAMSRAYQGAYNLGGGSARRASILV